MRQGFRNESERTLLHPAELFDAEATLCTAVRGGAVAVLGDDEEVRAEVVRLIVLGLPFADQENSIWGGIKDKLGLRSGSKPCLTTPVGISIKGGRVKETLDLASVVGPGGGPICPLAFEGTCFEGGFSGAHGRFSRLSFKDCRFVHPPNKEGVPVPTIDLTGAQIGGDLDMAGIHPEGEAPDSTSPREQGPYLWIRLIGARIDGEIDLCRSHLRAPASGPRLRSDDAQDALDLTLAEVKGDLQFLTGSRSQGRIKIRSAHISGDVWMSGATIENPGEQALLIQGTRIDGFLMMDGCFDDVAKTRPFQRFICTGVMKLESTDIGRSLYLQDAIVRGPIEAPHLTVAEDIFLHAEVTGSIDLSDCRVGGALDLSRLNLASSVESVSVSNGRIGGALRLTQPEVPYEFLQGRELALTNLPPLKLIETLWRMVPGGKSDRDEEVPLRRQLVQAAFLVDDSRPRDVRIFHLDGHADVLPRAIKRCRADQVSEAALPDLARLCGAYVLREDGFPQVRQPRWFENGLFLPPMLPDKQLQKLVDDGEWVAAAPLAGMSACQPHRKTKERFAHHIESNPLLQACFDLEGLSCDMLDDRGGRAWGEHNDRIRMNHFVYRRASWGFERRKSHSSDRPGPGKRRWVARFGDWGRQARLDWRGAPPPAEPGESGIRPAQEHHTSWVWLRKAGARVKGAAAWLKQGGAKAIGTGAWLKKTWKNRPWARGHPDDRVETWSRKSSHRWLRDRFKGALADYLWRKRRGRTATRLREESYYLEPWQVRRNWIYRQFTPLPVHDLISISRYRIAEPEYRPQPFEQAILVSRAEGREEFAVHFEMLKRRVEWRLFNQRIRWPLAGLAIFLAAGWLILHNGSPVITGVALLLTWFVMVVVSSINDLLQKIPWHPGRALVRELICYIPALALFALDDWDSRPFHFLVAYVIYLAIRFISVISNAVIRFGFGYLRRPVRAVVTLILAFLVGWWGVRLANLRGMFVIAAAPVANVAGPDNQAHYPPGYSAKGIPILMGSARAAEGRHFDRELPCAATMSEPLYALDVLIPLIDLKEEAGCEVRRVPHRVSAEKNPGNPGGAAHHSPPASASSGDSGQSLIERTLHDHRFWWWMKALYAIAGWFIVSLALLTFTQVNRTREEALPEGGRR